MNLNLHSIFRYYIPGFIFIFGLLMLNKVCQETIFYDNILLTDNNILNFLELTALPLVIGFILSWLNRGFYFGVLLPFSYRLKWLLGKKDYMKNRIKELTNLYNIIFDKNRIIKFSSDGLECYDQKRRLHEYFNYIVFGHLYISSDNNNEIDKFRLHRERIEFQLSDLHAAKTSRLSLISLFIFFLIFYKISLICIQKIVFLSIIIILIVVTFIFIKILNDSLSRYETILIRSKEFKEFFKNEIDNINNFIFNR